MAVGVGQLGCAIFLPESQGMILCLLTLKELWVTGRESGWRLSHVSLFCRWWRNVSHTTAPALNEKQLRNPRKGHVQAQVLGVKLADSSPLIIAEAYKVLVQAFGSCWSSCWTVAESQTAGTLKDNTFLTKSFFTSRRG